VMRPAGRAVIRTETKAQACRAADDQALAHTKASPSDRLSLLLWIVGEHISHGLRVGCFCHRCEQPLRVVLPPTGWVTALAGLLARGAMPARPPFPVSQWLTRTP